MALLRPQGQGPSHQRGLVPLNHAQASRPRSYFNFPIFHTTFPQIWKPNGLHLLIQDLSKACLAYSSPPPAHSGLDPVLYTLLLVRDFFHSADLLDMV